MLLIVQILYFHTANGFIDAVKIYITIIYIFENRTHVLSMFYTCGTSTLTPQCKHVSAYVPQAVGREGKLTELSVCLIFSHGLSCLRLDVSFSIVKLNE